MSSTIGNLPNQSGMSDTDMLPIEKSTATNVKTTWANIKTTLLSFFGTAAQFNVGLSANNVVQLDGSAKLPAVDASQLINVAAGAVPQATTSSFGTVRFSSSPSQSLGTVTISIASPAVLTLTGHGLAVNDTGTLSTTGILPTGFNAGTTYYVSVIVDANNFQLSATQGGVSIGTSGTQSGAHTFTRTSAVLMNRGPNLIVRTSSGSYTPTIGAKSIVYEHVGGGGGGQGSSSANSASGGGGSGYVRKSVLVSSLTIPITITVGGGGGGGSSSNGGTGGTTSFGSITSSPGGPGGSGGISTAGSTSTGGDINIPGGTSLPIGSPILGYGGSSQLGSITAGSGSNAILYGSGGSGMNGGATAGNGSAGVCIITEYF